MYLEGWMYFINFEARNQHSFYDHNFISYSLRVVWWPVRRAHTKTRLAGIHFCSFFLNIFLFWIFMKHSLNTYYIYLIYLISPIPHVSQTVPDLWGEPRQSKRVAVIFFYFFKNIFCLKFMKYYLKYFSHIFLLFYCNIIFHKSVDKIIRHENKAVQCTSRNTGSFSVLKRKMWGKMQHWLLGYTTMVESNKATHR